MNIKHAEARITEVSKERNKFMFEVAKTRQQLKVYENFINEARGQQDKGMVGL